MNMESVPTPSCGEQEESEVEDHDKPDFQIDENSQKGIQGGDEDISDSQSSMPSHPIDDIELMNQRDIYSPQDSSESQDGFQIHPGQPAMILVEENEDSEGQKTPPPAQLEDPRVDQNPIKNNISPAQSSSRNVSEDEGDWNRGLTRQPNGLSHTTEEISRDKSQQMLNPNLHRIKSEHHLGESEDESDGQDYEDENAQLGLF